MLRSLLDNVLKHWQKWKLCLGDKCQRRWSGRCHSSVCSDTDGLFSSTRVQG